MSTNRRSAPMTIIVLGDGLVGHIAAIALQRALPGCEVTLAAIDEPEPHQAEGSLILPTAISALDLAGLDEDALIRRGCAGYRLCERFDGWGDGPFAIDAAEQPKLVGAALHQLWLAHGNMPFEELLPGVGLSRAGRYKPTQGMPAEPALTIDPQRLCDLLKRSAQRLGVTSNTVRTGGIVRGEEDRTTITFADGRTVATNLIVEATPIAEPQGATLVAHLRSLPGPPMLYDQYYKSAGGWRAQWCGATGNQEIVVSSDQRGDRLDGREGWQRISYHLRPVATPFAGNWITLGTTPGPFLRLGLSLSLRLLSLLIDLLPAQTPEPLLIGEYNRRARLIIDDAFNFVAAFHGALDGKSGDGAVDALAAFRLSGRLPPDVGDLVGMSAWQCLQMGLSAGSVQADPIARSVPADRGRSALLELQQNVTGLPGRMPPYVDWLGAVRR